MAQPADLSILMFALRLLRELTSPLGTVNGDDVKELRGLALTSTEQLLSAEDLASIVVNRELTSLALLSVAPIAETVADSNR